VRVGGEVEKLHVGAARDGGYGALHRKFQDSASLARCSLCNSGRCGFIKIYRPLLV
jgi:hypothetical protein